MSLISPLVAFFATVVCIILLRPVAIAIGLVDVPNVRKSHEGEVPLVGGIAIWVGVAIPYAVMIYVTGDQVSGAAHSITFFTASFLLVIVGAWDDLRELSAFFRFTAQILAALAMVFGGNVVLTSLGNIGFGGQPVELGIFAVPFTVFATLGVINAVNMSDGLDGLSGSLTLVSLLGFALGIMTNGSGPGNAMMPLSVAAAVAGFLVFNLRVLGRKRATVFLGDAGSTFLGFILVWMAVRLSQGESPSISPAAMLWFLMVPIFDTVSMMLRRILKRRSPFEADKEHLHHVFLMAGFTVGETVGIMAALAAAGVVVGLGGTYFGVSDFLMAALFMIAGLLYLWVIMRAWKVMRFLRRSICRRSNPADRRSNLDRRKSPSDDFSGPERRSLLERRMQTSRRFRDPIETKPA